MNRLNLATPLLMLAALACNQAPTGPQVALGVDGGDQATTLRDLVVDFTADATDPNDDALQTVVTWWRANPGSEDFTETSLTGTRLSASETVKGQQWKVSVVVSDSELSAEPIESDPILIVNSVPEVVSVRLAPGPVDTLGALSATSSGADADGEDVQLDIAWYVDGTKSEVTGPILDGIHFGAGQEVWFEVTASDSEATSEPMESERVVILNTAPRATTATVTPAEPDGATDLTCTGSGWFDLDDDAENYEITWLVNGVESGTAAVLPGGSAGRDDLVRCTVTPFDGTDRGAAIVSPPVKIINTAPTLESVTLNPTEPTAGVEVTYVATGAADVDGDEVSTTAMWFVDGEMVHEGLTLPAFSGTRGQEITVEVTPTDGNLSGESVVSTGVTVANTPPEMVSVIISPDPVYTNDKLFPLVTATDVDGDRLTYTTTWYKNGTSHSTGVTVDGAAEFDKNDEWYVEVTANDGLDTSTTLASASVTVLNSAPTETVISLSNAEPIPGDEIVCNIDVDSTDADGDTLTKTLSWSKNGSPYSGGTTNVAGDTVPDTDTADGDIFVCTYTVTDGTETVTSELSAEVLLWRDARTLGNCSATGASGPSQSNCNTAYSGTSADGEISVTDGMQTWTAPLDGTYSLTAYGAAGGAGGYGSNDPYEGATLTGTIDLSEGDTITVLVGQEGESGRYYGAAGGGATWVMDSSGTLLMVAAGGGGHGYNIYGPSGCDGQAGSTARGASNFSSSGACGSSSASSGDGGEYYNRITSGTFSYDYAYGGGGAGYSGDGAAIDSSEAASSFQDGGAGGDGRYMAGGFGGGGAGGYLYEYTYSGYTYGPYGSDFYGSGGGGGYTGGDGGYYRGGGGASYNVADNATSTTGGGDGDGKLIIDLVP
ncbi:MAG: hypothetical protein AB8H79_08195 [Myxococcota bacterium]